jgi:hypothetical protein
MATTNFDPYRSESWAVSLALTFEPEEPQPTVTNADLALAATHRRDGTGIRVQVVRRQPDGSWLHH